MTMTITVPDEHVDSLAAAAAERYGPQAEGETAAAFLCRTLREGMESVWASREARVVAAAEQERVAAAIVERDLATAAAVAAITGVLEVSADGE